VCFCDFSFCLFDRSSIQLVKWILLHYYYHEWIRLSLSRACLLAFLKNIYFIPVCCFVRCCFALCFSSISFGVWFLEGKEKIEAKLLLCRSCFSLFSCSSCVRNLRGVLAVVQGEGRGRIGSFSLAMQFVAPELLSFPTSISSSPSLEDRFGSSRLVCAEKAILSTRNNFGVRASCSSSERRTVPPPASVKADPGFSIETRPGMSPSSESGKEEALYYYYYYSIENSFRATILFVCLFVDAPAHQ
jgi:hypothetical protein